MQLFFGKPIEQRRHETTKGRNGIEAVSDGDGRGFSGTTSWCGVITGLTGGIARGLAQRPGYCLSPLRGEEGQQRCGWIQRKWLISRLFGEFFENGVGGKGGMRNHRRDADGSDRDGRGPRDRGNAVAPGQTQSKLIQLDRTNQSPTT